MIYTTKAGTPLLQAVEDAIELSTHENKQIEFDYNGIVLTVFPDSAAADICTIYMLEQELKSMRGKTRGQLMEDMANNNSYEEEQ